MADKQKLPSMQFYPGDWRKDIAVQSLSFHDRGIWFEMLMLMHESERRGVLVLNGKAMSNETLGRILGLDPLRVSETVNTLLEAGVASREEETGAIYCRRMVRDQAARRLLAEAGKKGGSPSLGCDYNVPGFVYAIQRASDGHVKIGISANPSKRLYRLRYEQKVPLHMLATMATQDMGKSEAELHAKYAEFGSGEWFALPPDKLQELLSTLKGIVKGEKPPSSSSSTSKQIPPLPPSVDPSVYAAWREMRCKIPRAPFTPQAESGIIADLAKLQEYGIDPNARLRKALASSWRGVLFDNDKPALQAVKAKTPYELSAEQQQRERDAIRKVVQ